MAYAYEWSIRDQAQALTQEAVAEVKRLVGVPLRRTRNNEQCTLPAIIAWVLGIGDINPLYRDEGVGRRSRYGCVIAPPSWLYSVDMTDVAPKLRGIHTIYAGAEWEWYRVIKVGDEITVSAKLIDIKEKKGRFCGPMILQVGEVTYRNQRGEVVAQCHPRILRTPRGEAKARGKYLGIDTYHYTEQELKAVYNTYESEKIRGNEIRYWEDTHVGDEITPIVKGPLSVVDNLFFCNGANLNPLAFERWLVHRRRHPADVYVNPETGLLDSPAASIFVDSLAREFGFPSAHDTGVQRVAWLAGLLTNWMGDDGFLKKMDVDILLPNIIGDSTWCKGKVTGKRVENGEHLVECNIWAENQRKEVTAKGNAVMMLISKAVY